MYSQFFHIVIYITIQGGEFTIMALRPEEETRGKKKRPVRREKPAASGTGFFGLHLDFWPFSVRGEYPADKATHDAESARAMSGRRQTGRNQTQQTK